MGGHPGLSGAALQKPEFEKAALVGRLGHGIEDQAVCGGERAELIDAAFAAAVDREHRQVHFGTGSPPSHRFDDEDAAGRVDGLGASGEDAVGVLVVPVVQDVGQQIGVRPGREGVEEAARGHFGSVVEVVSAEGAAGLGRGGCEIDQMAANAGVRQQDRGEQRSSATADIDDGGESRPVETGDESRDLLLEPQGHLPVERLTQVRVFGEVGPEVSTVAAWVSRSAGGDAVGEFDQGQFGAAGRGVQVQQDVGETVVGIGAQIRAELGGPVAGGCRFDDPECRQVAEQEVERDRCDADFDREFRGGGAVSDEPVRQTEGHRDPQCHRCRQTGHATERVRIIGVVSHEDSLWHARQPKFSRHVMSV
nr:hypothetical protein [Nocardia amikacinitolerans]